MTTVDPDGLVVGAYLVRDDPRDALCGADAIRPGMRVGTASARRTAQLLALEPTLSIEPLRGNIDTRLRKRGERDLDAIVLAACGLDRLGLSAEIGRRLSPEEMLPEAGQGALAVTVRDGDDATRAAVERVSDAAALRCLTAERALVRALEADCHTPVGAHAQGNGTLTLRAFVGAADGGAWVRDELDGDEPDALGEEVAARLLAAGAREVLGR